MLKVFGCLCFVSTLKRDRSKLDERAEPCVFVGFSQHQKGYNVYILKTKNVLIYRDKEFHEKCLPYRLNAAENSIMQNIFLPKSNLPMQASDTLDERQSEALDTDSSSIKYQTNQITSIMQQKTSHNDAHNIPEREKKYPGYLRDYHCNFAAQTYTHWCNLISFCALSNLHKKTVNISQRYEEPTTYAEASTNPNWVYAIHKEIKALSDNHTWDVVTLPHNKKPIGNRWVYKVKLRSDGTLKRFKTRLVANGYNQKLGVDYEETFSPVVKMTTIRCILAVTANHDWIVHQLDVNNAFSHEDLHEEVYMTMPQGIPNPENKICLLRKPVHGLKQASRQWHEKLVIELRTVIFTQSKKNYSQFIKK